MSDYIDGWDMQDAMSRCADAEAELMKLRQRHAKLVEAVDRYLMAFEGDDALESVDSFRALRDLRLAERGEVWG